MNNTKLTEEELLEYLLLSPQLQNTHYIYPSNRLSRYGNEWFSRFLEEFSENNPEHKHRCNVFMSNMSLGVTYRQSAKAFAETFKDKISIDESLSLFQHLHPKPKEAKDFFIHLFKNNSEVFPQLTNMLNNSDNFKNYKYKDILIEIWFLMSKKNKIKEAPQFLSSYNIFCENKKCLKHIHMCAYFNDTNTIEKIYKNAKNNTYHNAIMQCEEYFDKKQIAHTKFKADLFSEEENVYVKYTININATPFFFKSFVEEKAMKNIFQTIFLYMERQIVHGMGKIEKEIDKKFIDKIEFEHQMKVHITMSGFYHNSETLNNIKLNVKEFLEFFKDKYLTENKYNEIKEIDLNSVEFDNMIKQLPDIMKTTKLRDKLKADLSEKTTSYKIGKI